MSIIWNSFNKKNVDNMELKFDWNKKIHLIFSTRSWVRRKFRIDNIIYSLLVNRKIYKTIKRSSKILSSLYQYHILFNKDIFI